MNTVRFFVFIPVFVEELDDKMNDFNEMVNLSKLTLVEATEAAEVEKITTLLLSLLDKLDTKIDDYTKTTNTDQKLSVLISIVEENFNELHEKVSLIERTLEKIS